MSMFKKFLKYLKQLFKKKHCGNCYYGFPIYVNKPIYVQNTYVYKRSKRKKTTRHLVGFTEYTSINCTCPKTQDKWAPYLRDLDFLMMTKPFKCCYYKRKET